MIYKTLASKERGRVLQALWNFLSVLIITVLLVQYPASVPLGPTENQPLFLKEQRWPTIIEMQDWCGANDGTGKFRKISQDLYEANWEIFYGIGTKITRELINAERISD